MIYFKIFTHMLVNIFSKIIMRLLLNISMNNHDKMYCHRIS